MGEQRRDGSKRLAQHLLAKQIVELAHGAEDAKKAETAHREAFSTGTTTFPLGVIRKALTGTQATEPSESEPLKKKEQEILAYKKAYAASSTPQSIPGASAEQSKPKGESIVTLPLSMLQPGSFPRILYAAGLASSKSDANRLIAKKGAYVVVPNSGAIDSPTVLKWITIELDNAADPNSFLIDWEALVLRSGKSKVQICRVVKDEQFEAEGLTCPGWNDTKAKASESVEEKF